MGRKKKRWESKLRDNARPIIVIVIVIECRLGATFFSQKWHPIFCYFWYNYKNTSLISNPTCFRRAFVVPSFCLRSKGWRWSDKRHKEN